MLKKVLPFLAILIVIPTLAAIVVLYHASRFIPMEAYTWSTLYLGGAIVSAISSLVTIPFAIWVLIMQGRYGSIVVRLFFNKIVNLFIIMLLSIVVTGVSMIFAFDSSRYVTAYAILFIESAVFVPLIGAYVLRLMTLRPSEIVDIVIKGATRIDEAIAALFKLAHVYAAEGIEPEAVTLALQRALNQLRKPRVKERTPPTPATWHELRGFLSTLIKKDVPLPSRKLLSAVLREYLAWLIMHRKDRAAAMLMRYYRRVAMKYLETRLPSEVVQDYLVEALIEPIERAATSMDLRNYAYEQLHTFLRHLRAMAIRGEVTRRELCHSVDILDEKLRGRAPCEGLEIVRNYIARIRREFRCRAVAIRREMKSAENIPRTSTATQSMQSLAERIDVRREGETSIVNERSGSEERGSPQQQYTNTSADTQRA